MIDMMLLSTPKLGDANFATYTAYCDDNDWGDNASYDLEILFKPHDEYDIGNSVCNNIESVFGRVSTLGNNYPTTLKNDQSYEIFDKSGSYVSNVSIIYEVFMLIYYHSWMLYYHFIATSYHFLGLTY